MRILVHFAFECYLLHCNTCRSRPYQSDIPSAGWLWLNQRRWSSYRRWNSEHYLPWWWKI